MAAAGAGAGAAAVPGSPPPPQKQEEEEAKAALFAAKHAELLAEARDVAREHGVTVRTVAFRPDGTAAAHELIGAAREERLRGMVGRAVARDVSAMAPQQVAAHQRQLLALRSVVLRELQARKTAAAAGATTKRAPVKQEVDGDGNAAKSRRTE